tara:strand:- start:245 stop:1057 length:813 start_codon:yes stop_codon:yes gene_type:complete
METPQSDSQNGLDTCNQEVEILRDQVEALKRQLIDAQRLTALGELVGTTTHEFNNILMTIMNYTQMAMRHDDEEMRQKSFDRILDASQRAAKITNSVLGMARNRSDTKEPTDLSRIIDDALVLLEREMNKYRISLDVQMDTVPLSDVNGNQIQQVLLNLLINARQAMPDGGNLWIRLNHDKDTNCNHLIIRDAGSGIAEEKLRKIFNPFFTTKAGPDESGKGGTGLGLSSCKHIIEDHQGKMRVESTVGIGTQFTIMLPVCESPSNADAA